MSTVETARNKAAFERFHDGINSRDGQLISKTIDEMVEPDLLFHAPVPVGTTGAQALKRVFEVLHQAFPDLHVEVEDMVAEADEVAGRSVVTGTHQGEYMGLAPSGKSVEYNEIFIFRFVDGRIAEIWGVVDVLTQMRQLGLIPA